MLLRSTLPLADLLDVVERNVGVNRASLPLPPEDWLRFDGGPACVLGVRFSLDEHRPGGKISTTGDRCDLPLQTGGESHASRTASLTSGILLRPPFSRSLERTTAVLAFSSMSTSQITRFNSPSTGLEACFLQISAAGRPAPQRLLYVPQDAAGLARTPRAPGG